jgi:hypothetical protein
VRKKVRSSLNSVEVNNFINAGDNGEHADDEDDDNVPKHTVNTQQQTPNMEKRNIQIPAGSVSSDESKENTGPTNVNFIKIII